MLMAGEPLGDEEKPILIESGFRRSVTMNGWRGHTRPNETKRNNQKQELDGSFNKYIKLKATTYLLVENLLDWIISELWDQEGVTYAQTT